MTTALISPDQLQLQKDLENSGVRVFTWPELNVTHVDDSSLLDEAIENLFGYDWLILKNVYAAQFFLLRLIELKDHAAELDDIHVIAIGEAASTRAIEGHVHVDILLDRHAPHLVIPSLSSYVSDSSLAGLNVLIPCANITHERYEHELSDLGARIDCVTAYQTTPDKRLAEVRALLSGGAIDVIAFSDAKSIENFASVFDTDDLSTVAVGTSAICFDEVTRSSAKTFGLHINLVSNYAAIAIQSLDKST